MYIDPKVGASGFAASVVTVVIGLLAIFVPDVGQAIKDDPEMAVAMSAMLTGIFSVLAGWFTRNAASPPKAEANAGAEERTTLEAEADRLA